MSAYDVEDRVLFHTLDALSKSNTIIEQLVGSVRRLTDALSISEKELAKLRAELQVSRDRAIA
jgi:hypothetical protein